MEPKTATPSVARMLVVGAMLASLAGGVLAVEALVTANRAVATETEVQAGGLSLWVSRYEWLAHTMNSEGDGGVPLPDLPTESGEAEPQAQGGPALQAITGRTDGFSMPQSMMPGTPPEGFSRLQVDFDVQNRLGAAHLVEPGQFYLEAEDGRIWFTLRGGTFDAVVLGEGLSYSSVAVFDVEDAAAGQPMYLVWRVGGQETRFQVSAADHH